MALERLQKILSECGVASRRKAEELIAAGKVKVNGHVASLGDKADPHTDVIAVCGKKIAKADKPVYLMLNKPRGYVTTLEDERGRKCVAELVKNVGTRVFPVGRLDKDSEGLLLFTNDGAFANAMMHPSGHIDKRYRVTVRGAVDGEAFAPFQNGVVLDGYKTQPAEVTVITAEPTRTVAEIVLHEGRNRQIRRTCEIAGLEVARLRRVALGPIKLGMLPVGKWRELTPKEVKALVQATGVTEKIAAEYIKNGGVPRGGNSSRR